MEKPGVKAPSCPETKTVPRGEKSGIGTTSPILHPALSCRPGQPDDQLFRIEVLHSPGLPVLTLQCLQEHEEMSPGHPTGMGPKTKQISGTEEVLTRRHRRWDLRGQSRGIMGMAVSSAYI